MTTIKCDCFERAFTSCSGACFDDARTYRYTLWRWWDVSRSPLVVCMLNPSTANEYELDPTLRRVQQFAKAYGHGGFIVVNAFALRSTDPSELTRGISDPVGPFNDEHIREFASPGAIVVAGWGSNLMKRQLRYRAAHLARLIPNAKCWLQNADGTPTHPLYQPSSRALVDYAWNPA